MGEQNPLIGHLWKYIMLDSKHPRQLWKQSWGGPRLSEAPRIYNTSLKVMSQLEGVACVAGPTWRSRINKGSEKGQEEVRVGEEGWRRSTWEASTGNTDNVHSRRSGWSYEVKPLASMSTRHVPTTVNVLSCLSVSLVTTGHVHTTANVLVCISV